jgi:hypothetical protein
MLVDDDIEKEEQNFNESGPVITAFHATLLCTIEVIPSEQ